MAETNIKKIAFLSFDWDYEIISEYYRGMDLFMREVEGLQVIVFSAFGHHHLNYNAEEGAFKVFDLCDLNRYDGVIVQGNRTWPPQLRQKVVDEARGMGKPVISINYDLEGAHTVGTDNYDAMRSLLERIFEDYPNIRPAYVNGLVTSVEAQARARAYRDVCAEHGVTDARFYQGSWQIDEGQALAKRLLAEGDELPDVFFCCNDDLAVGVQETLRKGGVSIPGEVMVTGFDNREISRNVASPITTVDRDYATVGRTALETMLALIAGEDVASFVGSPACLELRESCGYTSIIEAGDEDNLYSLGNSLKRFYEVLNSFQSEVYQADSLGTVAEVCENFASQTRCSQLFLTINDAYLHPERGAMPTTYHPLSHLMGWYSETGRPAPNDWHVYAVYPSKHVLPDNALTSGLYVVYPLRRADVCIGTIVTAGHSPVMANGFLTFCITLLAAGITSMHALDMLREANSRLDDLYVHDELTGLFNRFGLERFGNRVYEATLRDYGEVWLTFVDVDYMKDINDRLGHDQGDTALRDVADVIRRVTTRERAFAMRYGGDEFLLISSRDLAPQIDEQLRLHNESFRRPFDLTLSMGAIEISSDGHLDIDEAIRRADDKMYEIKRKRHRG